MLLLLLPYCVNDVLISIYSGILFFLIQGISVTIRENNIFFEAAGDIIRKIKKKQSFFKNKKARF